MNQGKRGRVLVTGATGFVAGHCIGDLLACGYDVCGTVRNLKTASIAHLRRAIDRASGAFDLAEAALDADEGWAGAASGCDYVLHVASPIPFKAPRHEDELIRPAVDGTTCVLMAAAGAGAKRVVCTSSVDMVTRNSATATRQRTEADWSNLAECNAYAKSKLLAEHGAWDLAAGMLGIQHDVTAEKVMRELGWTPRPLRESVLDTAESLISAGIVRPRKPAS
jgi:dihydroflavonol-4-reductase